MISDGILIRVAVALAAFAAYQSWQANQNSSVVVDFINSNNFVTE